MRLVRDIDAGGIFYYWTDFSFIQLSPRIPCLEIAKEWRDRHMFSEYKGRERRTSHIDRRVNEKMRRDLDSSLFFSRLRPQGRRVTDKPVHVDVDLAVEKLKTYC